jgi:hypothetical protein
VSAESELNQIQTLVRKLAQMPVPDISLAETIKDRFISWAKRYPRVAVQLGNAVKESILWAITIARARRTRTIAQEAESRGYRGVKNTIISESLGIARKRLSYVQEEFVSKAVGTTSFHLILTLRDFHEQRRRERWISAKLYETFIVVLGRMLEKNLRVRILKNIRDSFNRGGRLADDIMPGDRHWRDLSKEYLKRYPQKKGRRHFGWLNGGMKRNLWREGAVTIHFKGGQRGQGAKTVSADFGTTKAGKKLAMFYFGRERGRGSQGGRPFTFMTRRDMEMLNRLVKASFSNYVKANYSIFAGVRVGSMPAPMSYAEFHMFQIWSATQGADPSAGV